MFGNIFLSISFIIIIIIFTLLEEWIKRPHNAPLYNLSISMWSKYDRIPAPLAHVCPKFRPLILQDWNICSSTSSVLSWGLVAFKYSILLWICEQILLCSWFRLDVINNEKVATRWQSLLTWCCLALFNITSVFAG